MSRKLRKFLLVLAAVLFLSYAAAAALVSRIDLTPFTGPLEKELSDSLRVDIRVRGSAGLRLLPGLHAKFTDVALRTDAGEFLTVPEVSAGLDLFPLLRKEFRVNSLVLKKPVLTVRRAPTGEFNIKPSGPRKGSGEKATGPIPIADRGIVEEGTVRFTDEGVNADVELAGLNLSLTGLRLDEMLRFACAGEFRADRLRLNRSEISHLTGTLNIDHDAILLQPLRADLYGASLETSLLADLAGPVAEFTAELSGKKIPLGRVYKEVTGKTLIDGDVDLRAELAAHGPGRIVESLSGTVVINGSHLILHGIDLDALIADLRDNRNVDLIDIGSFVFAGPVGSLFSRGFDMATVYRDLTTAGKQPIDQAAFNWRLENGVAHTEDVAFRTDKNRMAFQGSINIFHGRYQNFTLALLDRKGCAELTEEITGPVADPSVKKIGLMETLAGPLVGILKKTVSILDPRDCKPFYQGSVTHPGE